MLNRRQKIAYGMARLGSSVLLSVFSFESFYVYWEYYKLDPALTGWVNAIGKFTIAFASFVIGYISDTVKTRWGKRKPFIFLGAPLLAVSFIMYFLPDLLIDVNDANMLFIYGSLWNSIFHFAYAFLLTPFQAWMPEITEPEERVDISALQNIANLLANAVGVVVGFVFPYILSQGGLVLLGVLVGMGLFEILLYLPPVFLVPVEKRTVLMPNIIKDMRVILSNQRYVGWIIVRGLISVAMTMVVSQIISFVMTVLGLSGTMSSIIFGAVLLIVIIIFFRIWGGMSKKIGKGPALIRSNIILIVALFLTPVIGLYRVPIPKELLGYMFIALGAAGISGFQLFPYAIMADIIHEDEIKTGENRAGLYTGFDSIPLNFFQMLAYIISGYVMSLPEIPEKGYTAGLIWWGPIAALFVIAGTLLLTKVDVDPFLKKNRGKET